MVQKKCVCLCVYVWREKGYIKCKSVGRASLVAQMVKFLPAGDPGSIPGSGRCPREVNGSQSSCLENPMDRGAWDYSPWGQNSRIQLND